MKDLFLIAVYVVLVLVVAVGTVWAAGTLGLVERWSFGGVLVLMVVAFFLFAGVIAVVEHVKERGESRE